MIFGTLWFFGGDNITSTTNYNCGETTYYNSSGRVIGTSSTRDTNLYTTLGYSFETTYYGTSKQTLGTSITRDQSYSTTRGYSFETTYYDTSKQTLGTAVTRDESYSTTRGRHFSTRYSDTFQSYCWKRQTELAKRQSVAPAVTSSSSSGSSSSYVRQRRPYLPPYEELKSVYQTYAGFFNASGRIFKDRKDLSFSLQRDDAIAIMKHRARKNPDGASARTLKYVRDSDQAHERWAL